MKRIIETVVYTIEDHPNPDKIYQWINENWHDLGDNVLQEMSDSLRAFADNIGAKVNWSISIVPDRGEFIRFGFGDCETPTLGGVMLRLDLSGNCPSTGWCYEETILDAFREAAKDASATLESVLSDIEHNVLTALHNEGDYLYGDDGLYEMCECNGYEFNAEGEIA
jgi:hypothetical protein